MTRPKVPPDQRQRTAQACNSCKRRKQKCNGLCPCSTCERRKFTCVYPDREAPSPSHGTAPPAKKVMLNDGTEARARSPSRESSKSSDGEHNSKEDAKQFYGQDGPAPAPNPSKERPKPRDTSSVQPTSANDAHVKQDTAPSLTTPRQLSHATIPSSGPEMSRTTSQSGQEEEAVVYMHPRMLQDPTGRLLYVGDSASLSFLQLLRMMVESVAGPSPFTTDPSRHKIVESQFSLSSSMRLTHLLPDRDTARVLVDAFYTNTQGLVRIFHPDRFYQILESAYSDPLSVEPSWLCHLNLVFAIGLMLATPPPDTPEYAAIRKLRNERQDRAEIFYLNAKSFHDPLHGFEDADFWSVQALLLMALYMLAKSKRNTSFALIGMAVRSAYSLGLHREETLTIFSETEQNARRDVWKSLFVLDRFISCQLGRPTAISEEECSGDALQPKYASYDANVNGQAANSAMIEEACKTSSDALDAAVRSCSAIGIILKRVYQQRKISTRLAQEIADICKMWSKALSPALHWTRASSASNFQGIAILHVNLLYCHSIVLLTRPFFLFIMNKETQKLQGQDATFSRSGRIPSGRMEKFGEACVIASTHTILLVQNAFDSGYLPRRNPLVIYFLFAAVLVILSNEFAGLYPHGTADQCIDNAVRIMSYCAETEPQASRLFYIMSAYRDVILQQRERREQAMRRPSSNIIRPTHHRKFSADLSLANQGKGSQAHSNHRPTPSPNEISPTLSSNPPRRRTSLSQQSSTQFSQGPVSGQHLSFVSSPTISSNIPTMTFSPVNTADYPPISGQNSGSVPQSGTPNNILSDQSPFPSESPHPDAYNLQNSLDRGLEATLPLLAYDDSSAGEEQIEFDTLWAWPTNGTMLDGERMSGLTQGFADQSIPLFGVMDG